MPSAPDSFTLISKCTVVPHRKSAMDDLKLSVSDLPMLSCHYIQKGCLFSRPLVSIDSLISLLKRALSRTLSHFPPLAGRLRTDSDGYIYITCNDGGVDFFHASALNISIRDVLSPLYVPDCVKSFFAFDRTVSYSGHYQPILAVQVTELADGIFIGCSCNHSVADGTSFWNFFNTFAELSRGVEKISRQPDFTRNSVLISPAVLPLPAGGPKVTFNENELLSERIFSFGREAILKLKARANNKKWIENSGVDSAVELMGKQSNDTYLLNNGKIMYTILETLFKSSAKTPVTEINGGAAAAAAEISSFQSLCALLWRAVTRARKLDPAKTTTFRMAVNCRTRLNPKMDPLYFGNAIQSIPTYASAGDVTSRDLRWCAEQLNKNVVAHDDTTIRRFVSDWEANPRCFPLGNFDGASMTMGSSPRFPDVRQRFRLGEALGREERRSEQIRRQDFRFSGKSRRWKRRSGSGFVAGNNGWD